MYRGGVTMNNRTAKIISVAGIVVPVVLLLYGLLIRYNIVDSIHEVTSNVLYITMIPWIIIAAIQFFWRARNRRTSALRLIGYHIAAALYVLLISGFMTPFIIAWVLLFIASYGYFAQTGVRWSIAALIVTAAIDIYLNANTTLILVTDIVVVMSLLIVGLTTVTIGQAQEVDGIELAQSKAQETLQRDRILTIINNLADAVLSTDRDGIIRIYNAASLNLLDTNKSLNGLNVSDVVSILDENGKTIDPFKMMRKSSSVVVRDDIVMRIGDEPLRLEVTYSPIRSSYSQSKKSEADDGYILIMRDITKAKSLEEERDEFISVVSHELRTPITIAEGTISNAQVMMSRGNVAKQILTDAITTAHDQVVFLSKMVNDLSTLSRAERGVADDPESIDVRELINGLYNEYIPQAEKRSLHLNLDLGSNLGSVMASRLYLKELLQGFITNALKYTKEGSITIHVDRKKDKVTFSIKDTGIGMSKTDQVKVFDKFYRSEDYRTRETGGTGLGLYVATKLARKLETTIELTSRLNYGSTFSFALPVTTDKSDTK